MRLALKLFLIAFMVMMAGKAYALCTVTTTDVAFGAYDVFSATPLDSTGTITVLCDAKAKVQVNIGPSPNSGGFNPRKMKFQTGADLLSYNLYTDPAMTQIWGDGTGGTEEQKTNVKKNVPWVPVVYGRVTPAQDVSQGLYSDTLTVTIIW